MIVTKYDVTFATKGGF